MIVVGVDVHKHKHTFVAVDQVGRQLSQITVNARRGGHDKAFRWAMLLEGAAEGLVWAVEDCRSWSAGLERDLLSRAQSVVRVPANLTTQFRGSGRERGKSDPIDALAVARAALQNPDLPRASYDLETEELRLLIDRHDQLVAERTRESNRLHSALHQLDPDIACKVGTLDRNHVRNTLRARLEALDESVLVSICRDLLQSLERLFQRTRALEKELEARTRDAAPELRQIKGCAALSTARLLAEIAGIDRFATEAKFARFTGTAPIPVWSGQSEGLMRLSRGGNRRLNSVLHMISLTQTRHPGPGKDYYDKQLANGKTKKAARRLLRRKLSRLIYRTLTTTNRATIIILPAIQPTAA